MAGEDDGRAAVQRVRDRRQRRLDARVVLDLAVGERDVEIDANEDALALEIQVRDRELHRPFVTSLRTRSTQRFE